MNTSVPSHFLFPVILKSGWIFFDQTVTFTHSPTDAGEYICRQYDNVTASSRARLQLALSNPHIQKDAVIGRDLRISVNWFQYGSARPEMEISEMSAGVSVLDAEPEFDHPMQTELDALREGARFYQNKPQNPDTISIPSNPFILRSNKEIKFEIRLETAYDLALAEETFNTRYEALMQTYTINAGVLVSVRHAHPNVSTLSLEYLDLLEKELKIRAGLPEWFDQKCPSCRSGYPHTQAEHDRLVKLEPQDTRESGFVRNITVAHSYANAYERRNDTSNDFEDRGSYTRHIEGN